MIPHDDTNETQNEIQASAEEARLTAYALGETAAEETAEIEERLAADPDARRVVEEARAMAALLIGELRAETAPALSTEQRAAVGAAANAPPSRMRSLWPLVGIAASVLAGLWLAEAAGDGRTPQERRMLREVAMLEEELASLRTERAAQGGIKGVTAMDKSAAQARAQSAEDRQVPSLATSADLTARVDALQRELGRGIADRSTRTPGLRSSIGKQGSELRAQSATIRREISIIRASASGDAGGDGTVATWGSDALDPGVLPPRPANAGRVPELGPATAGGAGGGGRGLSDGRDGRTEGKIPRLGDKPGFGGLFFGASGDAEAGADHLSAGPATGGGGRGGLGGDHSGATITDPNTGKPVAGYGYNNGGGGGGGGARRSKDDVDGKGPAWKFGAEVKLNAPGWNGAGAGGESKNEQGDGATFDLRGGMGGGWADPSSSAAGDTAAGPGGGGGGGSILLATLGKPERRALLQRNGRDFSNLFTTVANDPELFASYTLQTGDPKAGVELWHAWKKIALVRLPQELHADEQVAQALEILRGGEGRYAEVVDDLKQILDEQRRRAQTYPGTEAYEHPGEAHFRSPRDEPLSTFSADVDTASYANTRRFLREGRLPPPDAVRVEEMVNYFSYDYAAPTGEHPLAASVEVAACPWNTQNRLVRVGIKAREVEEAPPAANLVFLIDVSGSMRPDDKLPLLKTSLRMMAKKMREEDSVAMVTYAAESGVRLNATHGADQEHILGAIDSLAAGGSTNGGAGIQQAYEIAQKHFIKGGTNRVILATDGDFNVGITDRSELVTLIQEKAKSGVFLSVLGVGTGNIKDATLEQLADKGNGNYAYLDGLDEARKVLIDEMHGTLVTVAKDVKLQIEFNPVQVGQYRLVGYENRALAAADFGDDTKDAGEMGAGHTVTALYEIVPAGGTVTAGVDALRYQKPVLQETEAAQSGELLTVRIRYKQPDATESVKLEIPVKDGGAKYSAASDDFKFAAAVAGFGLLVRGSPSAHTNYDAVIELASEAIGEDPGGHRAGFLELARKAKQISGR